MINVEVTVAGPGGCINYEVELIKRALEAAGIQVDVNNPHPFEGEAADIEKYMKRMVNGGKATTHVNITVVHCPWGG